MAHSHRGRRIALCLTLGPLLFLLGWAAGYLYARGLVVRDHLARLEALAAEPPAALLTVERLAEIHAELQTLQDDLRPFHTIAPAGPALAWLPRLGGTLQSLPPLLEMTAELSQAGQWACQGAQPFAEALSSGDPASPLSERLAAALEQSDPPLQAMQASLARAGATRLRFQSADLLPALARRVESIDRLLPSLQGAATVLPKLAALLGQPGPRTYLLVAQNNDELRPAGGLIAGIGSLTIDRGRITAFRFEDSSAIENWAIPHPAPPEPLRRFMALEAWAIHDANWWPDFPTSAQATLDLYALNRRQKADGVLAFDLPGLALLVDAVGPLRIAGHGDALDGAGALEQIRDSWTPPSAPPGPPGLAVTPRKPFRAIQVRAYYQRQSGTAWFDDLALLDANGRNLLVNPSFEADGDGDHLPDGWQGVELASDDGQDIRRAHSGRAAAVLHGDPGANKALVQRLERSGQAGETFYLGGWGWVEAVGEGIYGLEATVEYADGTSAVFALNLPRREHEWCDGAAWLRLGEWWGRRTDLIGIVLQTLIARVQQADGRDLPRALSALRRGLDERHIQAYFADPELGSWLAEQGWEGSLPRAAADTLLVVDSNLGYNKVNAHVSSRLAYRLALAADGGGTAELTITYTNASPPIAGRCEQVAPYTPTYAGASEGCYWDYVRVYAPLGSRLISVAGADQVVEPAREGERVAFAAFFVLPPGQTRTLRFTYALPTGLIRPDGPYTLWVRKQAGTLAVPLTVEILPPPGGTGEGARFESDLQTDRRFGLTWR